MRCFLLFLYVLSSTARAQESRPGKPITCYGSTVSAGNHRIYVAPNGRLGPKQATIEVDYAGVPPDAQRAFGRAVGLWETALTSPVPIRIRAIWDSLPGGALASTRATKIYRNFAEAPLPDAWYPVALAEKLTGRALNGATESDIEITLNNRYTWYLGTDGNPPADRTDLVSVVLHEVAHGLGFTSGATVQGNRGSLRDDGYLLIYDQLLEDKSGTRLSTWPDPSPALLTGFTGGELYVRSPTAANGGAFPRVFAPPVYNPGASLSHLDEAAYLPGDPDALMTPYLANGESIHALGPVVLGILADLGWQDKSGPATDVIVYPNPGSGLFSIQLPPNQTTTDLRVFGLSGRLMKTANPASATLFRLDLAGLPNGVYVVRIATPTGPIYQRLVLLH